MPKHTSSGVIELIRHPLVFVRDLEGAYIGELVHLENGSCGQVISVKDELSEVMLFSSQPGIAGEKVYRSDQIVSISLSPDCLGKTIDALGNNCEPHASKQENKQESFPVDQAPRPISDRRRILKPLLTGVSTTDLFLPFGKGQRELLVGDRKTGKSTFASQILLTQTKLGSKIVYAVIGKLSSEIKQIQNWLKENNVADQVTLVISEADDPPTKIYQTPFTAMTVAEYLQSLGYDVVVILDDLTTHARYYREIALVGKRFPGRDSYPGDIFFTHARLLERAGCFVHPTDSKETSSISCFPIAETIDSELTDFIVSNLISITDGHVLFDTPIFAQGRRPAIHTGLSVTRVGKQSRSQLEQELGYTITSFFNLYEKVTNLLHFGAELTPETQVVLLRGNALLSFLKQGRSQVFSFPVMVLIVSAIWLDWFATATEKEIHNARDTVEDHYKHDHIFQRELDLLIKKTHSFSEFLETLKREKKSIMSIWQ